jgi:hypothetical protein
LEQNFSGIKLGSILGQLAHVMRQPRHFGSI